MIYSGSVALITGAIRGVGRAIALALAKQKVAVAINYRESEEEAAETWRAVQGEGAKSFMVQGDTSSDEDCKRMIIETVKALGKSIFWIITPPPPNLFHTTILTHSIRSCGIGYLR